MHSYFTYAFRVIGLLQPHCQFAIFGDEVLNLLGIRQILPQILAVFGVVLTEGRVILALIALVLLVPLTAVQLLPVKQVARIVDACRGQVGILDKSVVEVSFIEIGVKSGAAVEGRATQETVAKIAIAQIAVVKATVRKVGALKIDTGKVHVFELDTLQAILLNGFFEGHVNLEGNYVKLQHVSISLT